MIPCRICILLEENYVYQNALESNSCLPSLKMAKESSDPPSPPSPFAARALHSAALVCHPVRVCVFLLTQWHCSEAITRLHPLIHTLSTCYLEPLTGSKNIGAQCCELLMRRFQGLELLLTSTETAISRKMFAL